MTAQSVSNDEFEREYWAARLRIDKLCDRIRQHGVTSAQAVDEYGQIECDYLSSNQEKADLFKMIYKNRIVRLCDQYLTGGE